VNVLIVGIVAVYAVAAYALVRAWNIHRLGRVRLAEQAIDAANAPIEFQREGPLHRWLALAGFRHPAASLVFVTTSSVALGAGLLLAFILRSTVVPSIVATVSDIPGGVGELSGAMFEAAPWLVLIVISLVPVLVVRSARRRRVRELERDLPLVLELFATLAQAGLGFDAALSRIVESQPAERPLTAELVNFQRDLMGGTPRLLAFRHLARRVDTMAMTIFVSAIIQAEHVGASISETLQHQADDLRNRRREQALLSAQALPVKLVFPLIACFLPGIFVSTLGPVLFQMVQVANSVLRTGR
jgi:tight adherence protein C